MMTTWATDWEKSSDRENLYRCSAEDPTILCADLENVAEFSEWGGV